MPFARISHDMEIMGGKPCIKGTRCTVGMIVSRLSEGMTAEALVAEYPYLSLEDVAEALRYAAWMLDAREMSIQSA